MQQRSKGLENIVQSISFSVMVFVNLQLKIKQGLESDFVEELKKHLPDTRAFDGCHALYFGESQEGSGNFEFFSKWTSKEHYDKYIEWRTESGLMGEIANKYFEGEPVWRFFNIVSDY